MKYIIQRKKDATYLRLRDWISGKVLSDTFIDSYFVKDCTEASVFTEEQAKDYREKLEFIFGKDKFSMINEFMISDNAKPMELLNDGRT